MAGWVSGNLAHIEKIGCWRLAQRATARCKERDSNQTATHVELFEEGLRTGVQIPPAPPLLKPQLFSVGVFSRLLATVPACLRGFMRTPADFAGCLSGPFSAAFRSLLAILLLGFALREWPGVRKGTVQHPFKSTGYARTVQAVGSRHCLPGGELPRPGGCPFRPYRLGSTAAAR